MSGTKPEYDAVTAALRSFAASEVHLFVPALWEGVAENFVNQHPDLLAKAAKVAVDAAAKARGES